MANKNESMTKDEIQETGTENKSTKPETKKEGGGLLSYFIGVKQEMAKVVWPTREELSKDTIAVFGVCIFFSLIFWGMDTGFLAILKKLLGITLLK